VLLRFGQPRYSWPEVGNAVGGPGGRLIVVAVCTVVRRGLVLDSVAVVVAVVAGSTDLAEVVAALDAVDTADTADLLISTRTDLIGSGCPLMIERH